MAELKYSELLLELIESAKKVDNKLSAPFTAERFVVAVIDLIQAGGKRCVEYMVLRDVLKGRLPDIEGGREKLMAYICRDNPASFLDDLYMKKRLRVAQSYAAEHELEEVDAICVMVALVDEPSEMLKELFLYPAPNKEEEPEQKAEEEPAEQEEIHIDMDFFLEALMDQTEPEVEKADPKSEIGKLVAEVKQIRAELKSAVFGQDNAINVFTTGYFQANLLAMTDKSRKRPKAIFLFAGPPGVGKTFLAERIAASLQKPFMRFDMSEYADDDSHMTFAGFDNAFKGSHAGEVTGFVSKNPECVLLFDEIEKAHPRVIHLFLQLLDAGRVRDAFLGQEISFTDTIVILTTNAGRQLYNESETDDLSGYSRKVIIKALEKDVDVHSGQPFFPAAICSRLATGNVVMFNHMDAHNLRTIAQREVERHANALGTTTGLKVRMDERIYTALLLAEGSAADARTIRARAESFFNDELYELLRLISSSKVKTNIDALEEIRISVDLDGAKPEIRQLFAASGRPQVLVFAAPETVQLCQSKVSDMDLLGVQDTEEAIGILQSRNIDFILLDMKCGAQAASLDNLNLEDVQSPARDFFMRLRQHNDLPLYLLEGKSAPLSEEEKVSFLRQGVRGIVRVAKGKDTFAKEMAAVADRLYQQANMVKLAKENKLVSFETAQMISKNGKVAQIRLFDFRMAVAVDAEDSKNILSALSKPNVRFTDVIGAEEAKKELAYFVEYLKNPKKYIGTGVKAPKGVILYGPPGTGKTMLAKAMACEAGVTFIAAEGNQFLKKYVGEGSEKVHELFKTARKYAPAILFIDEIDAIAKERKGGEESSGTEATLTAFLAEMDGFASDPTKPVFVLAATNFKVEPGTDKSLDPALMRRFDRRVFIDRPDKDARIRFMKRKIGKNPAFEISEKQVENVAMRATGMSLAELDSVFELALRSAIREGSTKVTDAILEEAFETFNGGEVKKWDISQLERVARHEAGHAFLCWLSGETPSYLTIVARGNHGGYMQHAEQEGKAIYTKDELLARIRTSLGGRAAEIVYYGAQDGISTGASGDLASATSIAQSLVCSYGMDENFGLAVVSGMTAAGGVMSVEVRAAVNRILSEQMALAVQLIAENKAQMDALVDELMSKNHLTGEQIEQALALPREASRIKKAD
ncbi:MAG: AAA family ATPase [Ruminococcaceae bacterium]|nr:AAA family ATPase [Oscillospiraceae bacterium]